MCKYGLLILIVIITTGLVGCGPDAEEWLSEYQATLCDSVRVRQEIERAAREDSVPLRQQQLQLQNDVEAARRPYQERIGDLRRRIKREEEEYWSRYEAAKKAYEARYGHGVEQIHILERQEEALQVKRDRVTEPLEAEIATLEKQMQNAPEVLRLQEELREVDDAIKTAEQRAGEPYQARLTEFSHKVKALRERKMDSTWRLKGEDREAFNSIVQAAEEAPCRDYTSI